MFAGARLRLVAPAGLRYDTTVPPPRILGHALVLSYLAVIVLGTAHAVRRLDPVPFGRVTIFFYGMLAPYQGYSEVSEGYLAEVLVQGAWYPVDLAPYYPVLPGERSMREWHTYANWAHYPSEEEVHRAYAERLLELVDRNEGGRHPEALRLSWVQWRPQPHAFRAEFDEPIQSRLLVTVP